jgi:hypothetical protein
MQGKPGSTKPVFCMKVAGPCTLDLACMECTKAMSSAQDAMCGTSSLIHFPHWPRGFHSHGLFITAPGLLWNNSTLPPGSNFSPLRRSSSGL